MEKGFGMQTVQQALDVSQSKIMQKKGGSFALKSPPRAIGERIEYDEEIKSTMPKIGEEGENSEDSEEEEDNEEHMDVEVAGIDVAKLD